MKVTNIYIKSVSREGCDNVLQVRNLKAGSRGSAFDNWLLVVTFDTLLHMDSEFTSDLQIALS